jgi:hypothetical protein
MNGRFNSDAFINEVLWSDSSIESVYGDYERFVIIIQESTGTRKEISCSGYIGYQLVGFWDEVIVQTAHLYYKHDFIDNCVKKTTNNPLMDSGCEDRTLKELKLLEINLLDGVCLYVVGSKFNVNLIDQKK